jgi:hypothetical protein
MSNRDLLIIGWKLTSLNINVASVRYRCMLPVLALRKSGIVARVFSKALTDQLDGLACLVFVKSFNQEDYFLALQASRRRIPIVLDLCDNIFIDGYGIKHPGAQTTKVSNTFKQMADLASMVVVTTAPLAEVVRQEIVSPCPIVIIPDGIETESDLSLIAKILDSSRRKERLISQKFWRNYFYKIRERILVLRTAELRWVIISLALKSVQKNIKIFLSKKYRLMKTVISSFVVPSRLAPKKYASLHHAAGLPTVVWFGHHGAAYASFGMLDLQEIRGDLEAASREHPFELVVVSNNYKKFNENIRLFELPTRYVEWSLEALAKELSHATVAIVPNTRDDFSVCKSANRILLALHSGVPVVANSTPASRELESCVVLDDFSGGLSIYLGDPERREADVKSGQALIQVLYGNDVIRDSWVRVIKNVTQHKPPGGISISPVLLVVVQSQLDWVWLSPVVREGLAQSMPVEIILDGRHLSDLGIVPHLIKELGVSFQVVHPDHFANFIFPASIRALLCATESNLSAHRLAHLITKHARKLGIYTAVLQHGYEAPGLTYHDSLHSIRQVEFASERIYLWGEVELLHPLVSAATRDKCLSVGLPWGKLKSNEVKACKTSTLIIGIFENLHWHRYTEQYRQFFITELKKLAKGYPEVRFMVRAHPSGRWFWHDEALPLLKLQNFSFAPELRSVEESLYALFNKIDGVITTPSTIAVMAAQAGLPTAVVGGGLDLGMYKPLTELNQSKDLRKFLEKLLIPSDARQLCELSSEFVTRVIRPGDAARLIVKDIRAHF